MSAIHHVCKMFYLYPVNVEANSTNCVNRLIEYKNAIQFYEMNVDINNPIIKEALEYMKWVIKKSFCGNDIVDDLYVPSNLVWSDCCISDIGNKP